MEASFKGDDADEDGSGSSSNKSQGEGVLPQFKPSNKFSSKSMLQIKANAMAKQNEEKHQHSANEEKGDDK